MSSDKYNLRKIVLSGMFLALAIILPLITGQMKQIGNALCPMHIPVILCGFLCGPVYGLVIGFISPILRFILFGMPVIVPSGIAMSFELMTYGFVSGYLYKILPKKKPYIYVSLISAMVFGRIIWGISRTVLYGLGKSEFGWKMFIAGAFLNAVPGIIIQIILIPLLVIIFEKYNHDRK